MRDYRFRSKLRALISMLAFTAASTVCVRGDGQAQPMRDSLDQDVTRLETSATELASREYFVQAGSIAKTISAGRTQENLSSVAAKLLSNMMAKKLDALEVGAADLPAKAALARYLIAGAGAATTDERRRDLQVVAQFLGRIREERLPNFVPKPVVANVALPRGVPGMAGMSPAAISDPAARADYEAAIRDNQMNSVINSRQASISDIDRELTRPIVDFMVRIARPDAQAREVVRKSAIEARLNESEQAEIMRALD